MALRVVNLNKLLNKNLMVSTLPALHYPLQYCGNVQ